MAPITDYHRFLGASGKRRLQNGLNKLGEMQYTCAPGTVAMCTGAPNPELFPFQDVTVTLLDGSAVKISRTSAFQYSATIGQNGYQKVMRDIIETFHSPPTLNLPDDNPAKLQCLPTTGNMDGMAKAFSAMLGPGDNLIVEEFTYPMQVIEPHAMQVNLLPVKMDNEGMIPSDLRRVLSKWSPEDALNPDSDIPRVINVIPTGHNPTGATLSLKRRKEIYKIAQEYNLIIVEDDPYYLIQYEEPIASFLSMDTDGRVVRCESFSKSVAPGLRAGFIAGPARLIQKVFYHTQVSSFQTCSFSQAVIGELFKSWGMNGFIKHSKHIQSVYRGRRDAMMKYAEKHMKGLAQWEKPRGGMYLWMRLKGITDSSKFIPNLLKSGVILAPGGIFSADMDKPCSHMRVSFSVCSEEDMDQGFDCLATAVREHLAKSDDGA